MKQIFLVFAFTHGLAWAQPVVSSVLNAASYDAVLSPGCLVAIFGSNLGSANLSAGTVPPPVTLGGVSVSVAGMPSVLLHVSPRQINAMIPAEVGIPVSTVVPLVVTYAGVVSTSYNIRLTRNSPAIFTRNGVGTGPALVFDSNFQAKDIVAANDILTLYATGLGATSGRSETVVDPVEVYVGERKARVLFAGLAPGLPGVYQLNVIAAAPATNRLYLRSGGWQSNIVDIGIASGANTSNVKGTIDSLHPSAGPVLGTTSMVMLHAGAFTVSFDINPSAGPFDVAAVGEAGGTVISIDPATGSYRGFMATVTAAAAVGDFSASYVPLWDYLSCDPRTWECLDFPLSTVPPLRLGMSWVSAAKQLPSPSSITSPGVNAIASAAGCLGGFGPDESCVGGSHFVVDRQNNTNFSTFGGIVQLPLGPLPARTSTFKLYVDGVEIASKTLNYRPSIGLDPPREPNEVEDATGVLRTRQGKRPVDTSQKRPQRSFAGVLQVMCGYL